MKLFSFKGQNNVAIGLILISLVALVPGLTLDIISFKVGIKVPILGEYSLMDESRSILGTVQFLTESKQYLVAFLIFWFSVLVPVIKAVLLLLVLMIPSMRYKKGLYAFIRLIGKWSMADVFVVAILIAFLSVGGNSSVQADIHSGYYWFLAYCLLSLLGIQLVSLERSTKEM